MARREAEQLAADAMRRFWRDIGARVPLPAAIKSLERDVARLIQYGLNKGRAIERTHARAEVQHA
jgi:hypothetical protein